MSDIDIFNRVKRPGAYGGCEIGGRAYCVPKGGVNWVLAFPDAYELGSTHTGFQIVYHVINSLPYAAADRVFMPWIDYLDELKKNRILLRSIEQARPLKDFDIVGFSLAYELGFTNVLHMLDAGGIPLRSSQRKQTDPLIVAGGVCTVNPEPMSPFIDAFAIGDGEDVAVDITNAVKEAKEKNFAREKLLDSLAEIKGVYVPSRHDGKKTVVARRVADLDAAPFPTCTVVPSIEAVQDRVSIEIARGCPNGCRFCQAGFIYRPLRERSPDKIAELAETLIKNTGFSDLTLLSLSTGDYPRIVELIGRLNSTLKNYHTGINLPSLRADSITPEVVESIKHVRKTGFTIAPEAGSERLRRALNKKITDNDIVETSRIIFTAGWRLVKLYFMFGLPTETREDLEAMRELILKVRKTGLDCRINPEINVGIGVFIPKPHTPFQWEPMLKIDEIEERTRFLKNELRRIPGVKLTWPAPKVSLLEGLISRGDKSVADVIERAYINGACFDGWNEQLKFDAWEKAFRETGIDAEKSACAARNMDEPLPWSFIKIGASKKFLLEERKRALDASASPACGDADCEKNCGGCAADAKVARIEKGTGRIDIAGKSDSPEAQEAHRYRIVYSKLGPAKFLGHLDTVRILLQSIRRANLPVKYSEGFHPMPKARFGAPLPLGIASLAEIFDVDFEAELSPEEIVERMNKVMPRGFETSRCEKIDFRKKSPQEDLKTLTYLINSGENGIEKKKRMEDSLNVLKNSPNFIVEVKTKSGSKKTDLKQKILNVALLGDGGLEIDLIAENGAAPIRPDRIFESIFGGVPPYFRVLKTKISVGDGTVWGDELKGKKNVQ